MFKNAALTMILLSMKAFVMEQGLRCAINMQA